MQTRVQGGYVDPGWGKRKAKTSPTDRKKGTKPKKGNAKQ
jgi:hypothetical protein